MPFISDLLTIGDDFIIGDEAGGVPELAPEAARLLQQILPVARHDDQYDYAATHLCAALMAPVERLARTVLEDGDRPGYSRMLNVDDADVEDLRWLGLFNGTSLSGVEAEEEQRRLIREARGSHRGRTSAIISDVKATLTGTAHVDLLERQEGPFQNIVTTRVGETPNETATRAALNDRRTKPLGAIYTLIVTDTWLVGEVEATYPGAGGVGTLEGALLTVKAVEEHGVI